MALKTIHHLLENLRPADKSWIRWCTLDGHVQLSKNFNHLANKETFLGWSWRALKTDYDNSEGLFKTRQLALNDALATFQKNGVWVNQSLRMEGSNVFVIKDTPLSIQGRWPNWMLEITGDDQLWHWWQDHAHLQNNLFAETKNSVLTEFYNVFVGTGKAMEYSWMKA